MTVILNNPRPEGESGQFGLLIGFMVIVVFGIIFIFYGLPALKRMSPVEITVPTEIKMPDKVDVNVTQPTN